MDRESNLAAFLAGNHPKVPRVLYHGTNKDFSIHDPEMLGSDEETSHQTSQLGHWFTGNPEQASEYAIWKTGHGANVQPVHISLKKPAILDWDDIKEEDGWDLQQKLIRKGHDGAIVHSNGPNLNYVVFTPHQIKSAIGNQGTFDPTNPDITKGDGGEVDGITAYHGSPHEFEQFDTSKIGTGEGAQAYGHGLYFSESHPVADDYRIGLSNKEGQQSLLNGRPLNEHYEKLEREANRLHPSKASGHYEKMSVLENMMMHEHPESILANADDRDLSSETKEWIKNKVIPNYKQQGHMYEVHIDAHPDHFLDWDKPLSEQSEHVQNLIKEHFPSAMDDVRQQTGQNFYKEQVRNMMAHTTGNINPEQFISNVLSHYGIHGIRYLDAGSRGPTDQPTHNYVVFDHGRVNIKRRYAEGGEVEREAHSGGNRVINKASQNIKSSFKPKENLVKLYHGTTAEGLSGINLKNKITGPAYFSPRYSVAKDYSLNNSNEPHVIETTVPKNLLHVDFDLPGGRLLNVEDANEYTGNHGWTIDDYLSAGHSVGVPFDVPIKKSHGGEVERKGFGFGGDTVGAGSAPEHGSTGSFGGGGGGGGPAPDSGGPEGNGSKGDVGGGGQGVSKSADIAIGGIGGGASKSAAESAEEAMASAGIPSARSAEDASMKALESIMSTSPAQLMSSKSLEALSIADQAHQAARQRQDQANALLASGVPSKQVYTQFPELNPLTPQKQFTIPTTTPAPIDTRPTAYEMSAAMTKSSGPLSPAAQAAKEADTAEAQAQAAIDAANARSGFPTGMQGGPSVSVAAPAGEIGPNKGADQDTGEFEGQPTTSNVAMGMPGRANPAAATMANIGMGMSGRVSPGSTTTPNVGMGMSGRISPESTTTPNIGMGMPGRISPESTVTPNVAMGMSGRISPASTATQPAATAQTTQTTNQTTLTTQPPMPPIPYRDFGEGTILDSFATMLGLGTQQMIDKMSQPYLDQGMSPSDAAIRASYDLRDLQANLGKISQGDKGGGNQQKQPSKRMVYMLMPDGTYQLVEEPYKRGGVAKKRIPSHNSAIVEHALAKISAPPPALGSSFMVAKRGRPF